jgi:GAF domain-containing protein
MVGLWGATESSIETADRLRSSGVDDIVVSLAEAVVQLANYSAAIPDEMIPAPIPANEPERLAALKALNILDTMPEDAFDRITAKVAKIFEVPIALVSFIDVDRQWFKSETGLPDDLAKARATSRAESICGHVVASDQPLTVEDIARDRRFANNPMLLEHGLRFYAGVPLRIEGFPIGSLCILDHKPRRLTEREQRLLEVLAQDVVDEIKRRAESSVSVPAAA